MRSWLPVRAHGWTSFRRGLSAAVIGARQADAADTCSVWCDTLIFDTEAPLTDTGHFGSSNRVTAEVYCCSSLIAIACIYYRAKSSSISFSSTSTSFLPFCLLGHTEKRGRGRKPRRGLALCDSSSKIYSSNLQRI